MPRKDSTKRAARNRAYYAAHREEILAQKRAYDKAHREEDAAYHRAYDKAHREERAAKRRAAGPTANGKVRRAGKRAYDRARHEAHRDELNASQRARVAADPERAKLKRRAWIDANPDGWRAIKHNYRARKRGNGGKYTAQEWRALCDWFGNVCLRCGKTRKLSVDHVVPVAKGGSNAITNLQPLCRPCNSTKHTEATDYRDADQLAAFLLSLRDD